MQDREPRGENLRDDLIALEVAAKKEPGILDAEAVETLVRLRVLRSRA
jgi:hypothetical protein